MRENQPEHELLPLRQPLCFQQQPAPQAFHQEAQQRKPYTQHPTGYLPQAGPSPGQLPRGQLGEEAEPTWTNFSRLLLLLLLASSLCGAIVLLIYYAQQNLLTQSKGTGKGSSGVTQNTTSPIITQCISQACQRASVRLSSSVDPFTHPCDYFLFTCGADRPSSVTKGGKRGEFLPWRSHGQGTREAPGGNRRNALMQYLREALESSSKSGSAVQKVKDFYLSCLDTKSIESAGVEPFLTLVQDLGGWAESGQWNHSDFNSTLSMLIKQYSSFPFFNLYVGKVPNEVARGRGSKRKYIQIDEPDLLIPIEWNNETQRSIATTQTLLPFLALSQKYLALLGTPESSSILHVGVFISLSSELALATAPLSYRRLKGQLYQRITIKELQDQAPAIDWLDCLQAAFHPHPVGPEDHVLLHNFPYLVQMSRIIRKWLSRHDLRSSRPLHIYMFLNLLRTFTPALDSRFRETERNFSMALGILKPEVPRWKHCVRETERGFDTILTYILNDMVARREAEEMLQNIFSVFKAMFNDLPGLDENSQQFVVKKVHSLTARLWTRTENPSEAQLDLLFSQVTISAHSYFSNYIQLLSLQQKRRYKLFSQTEEVDILSVTPFLSGNEVLFPMGMFVPPFFHATYPRAMNYGVLGTVIAKDIFHLLLQEAHFPSETVRAVADCVWAQYLVATGRSDGGAAEVLSAAQQREIWVQYSALQVAFEAYHQSLKKHPDDSSLSVFSHTHLFLTSFAQVYCDSDPYHESMPFKPSFLITVLCSTSQLCSEKLECPSHTQQHLLNSCSIQSP